MKEIWLISETQLDRKAAFAKEGDAVQTCYESWSKCEVMVNRQPDGNYNVYAKLILREDENGNVLERDDSKLVARIEKLELFHQPDHM